jgi:hypothetical protein
MLSAMAQCYLPGKMADNMHSHKKSDHLMFILPPALFLHSSPHNRVIKCLDFLTFIDKFPYTYFTVDKALCMAVCYLFIYLYFIFTIFLLTEQMCAVLRRCARG